MSRRDRKPARPGAFDMLESRCLLTAPQVLGNAGQILSSQFEPFVVRTTVTAQLRDVRARGPIKVDVVNPGPLTGVGDVSLSPPPNSGLITSSQFNGGGFLTVGLQFDHVYLGSGLAVSGFDNENNGAVTPAATVSSDAAIDPDTFKLPTTANAGLVSNSQYNDGGFGIVERNAAEQIVSREGRVGFQWRNTRVRGPVDVGLGVEVIQPGTSGSASAVPDVASAGSDDASTGSPPTSTVINFITNMGHIQGSQFNDGGFGDIGMQWLNVTVGGHVATSSNTLFINPQQDNYPAITVENQVFGQTAAGASTGAITSTSNLSNDAVTPSGSDAPVATADDYPILTTYDNAPTNSGRLVGAQFNDGGFGDVGLQWRKVSVGGSVTAVHNSLTVQPQNNGQGLITVQGIQFPTAPAPTPRPARERVRAVPNNPPVIVSDGNSVKKKLPKPTGPLSPYFSTPLAGPGTKTLPYSGNYPLVNAATNSGLVRGGQFNAGGFGDEGLQWQKVHVGGNVQIVHNSLSVQPEGTMLAGVSVSNVSYGAPVSPSVAQHLSVLPYAVISPGDDATGVGSTGVRPAVRETRILNPPNDRRLTNQQLGSLDGTDVYLEWNGIEHSRGLVLVHNIIQIQGVGPTTGPITLSNIRFPFRVPTVAPLEIVTVPAAASASSQPQAAAATIHRRAAAAKATPRQAELLNVANNSGIISHAQFNDGGFGDIGLQWRNVSVAGSVAVVHNTLAVNTTADPSTTDVPGPITVSNVTFNSGALSGRLPRSRNQVIVSPPDYYQRKSTHPVNLGQPVPQSRAVKNESTNTGILAGGQLSAGGSKHVMLQWQCVKVSGKVTVEDNVLSISVLDRPSAPITISNVTFA